MDLLKSLEVLARFGNVVKQVPGCNEFLGGKVEKKDGCCVYDLDFGKIKIQVTADSSINLPESLDYLDRAAENAKKSELETRAYWRQYQSDENKLFRDWRDARSKETSPLKAMVSAKEGLIFIPGKLRESVYTMRNIDALYRVPEVDYSTAEALAEVEAICSLGGVWSIPSVFVLKAIGHFRSYLNLPNEHSYWTKDPVDQCKRLTVMLDGSLEQACDIHTHRDLILVHFVDEGVENH